MIPNSEVKDFIRIIKKALRESNITYSQLADKLDLSEASVKRIFSTENMSLARMGEILAILQLSLHDITERMKSEQSYISKLTPEQESFLTTEPKMLMTFFLLLNGWTLPKILEIYNIDQHELTHILASLDKMRLIELFPNNRVKLLTARHFTWNKNGAVHKFIQENLMTDFLNGQFSQSNENLHMMGGLISESSYQKVDKLIYGFIKAFDELIYEDSKLPFSEKRSYGVLMAFRPWEYKVFKDFRKEPVDVLAI